MGKLIAKHCPLKQGLWPYIMMNDISSTFYCKTLSTKTRIVTFCLVCINHLNYIAKHCPLKQGLWLINTTRYIFQVPFIAKHCLLKQGLWQHLYLTLFVWLLDCKTLSTKTRIVTPVIIIYIVVAIFIAKHCPLKQGLWQLINIIILFAIINCKTLSTKTRIVTDL